MPENKDQAITVVTLCQNAIELYKRKFVKLFLTSLGLAVYLRIVHFLVYPSAITQDTPITTLIFLILLNLLVSGYFAIMLLHLLDQKGDKTSFKRAFDFAADKVLPILVATILIYLILTIGFILLIIPSIYLAIKLIFVFPVMVTENKEAMDAIKRSFQVTKGHWWQCFINPFIANILPFLVYLIMIRVSESLPTILGLSILILYKALIFPFSFAIVYLLYVSFSSQELQSDARETEPTDLDDNRLS